MRKSTAVKNVTYTLMSNLISFLISAIVTFFVPKSLGVESYGFFQLYIFYSSYTGLLYFGWGDGIFLRYGGAYYDKLNKARISGQFWWISVYAFIINAMLMIYGLVAMGATAKGVVFSFVGLYILVMWPKTVLQYILQCTNRIKEYSHVIIIERVVYLLLVIMFLLIGVTSFVLIILADIIGKLASLFLLAYYCCDIVRTKPEVFKDAFAEIKENIRVGIKLLLSNLAGILVVGIVRFAIEQHWDIATFGKVSLSLSVSNMLMMFVNAVALVMFPILRRMDKDKYAEIYTRLRNALMLTLLCLLITYYPMKTILSIWLPQYSDSLRYMAILFPICIFESKNNMLITTYMKALRQEKQLLIVNATTMLLSLILTFTTVTVLGNLDAAVFSIVLLLGFRCVISELIVSKTIHVKVAKDIILELSMVGIFIASSWIMGGVKGAVAYACGFIVYIIIKRKDAIDTFRYVTNRT